MVLVLLLLNLYERIAEYVQLQSSNEFKRSRNMEEYAVRPALSGLVATSAMSSVLGIARKMGLLGTPPPKRITASALRKMGHSPSSAPTPLFRATWIAAHLGYGAFCGVLYHPVRRSIHLHRYLSGLAFGLFVWAASYLGMLPALGLYPRADRDKNARTASMIVGHIVFGIALAESNARLSAEVHGRDRGSRSDV